jgi:hypothetical protein
MVRFRRRGNAVEEAQKSRAAPDASLLMLLAANLVALGVAWASGMTLRQMMLVYWIQSVVIGITTFIRIRSLHRFDVAGFSINGRPAEETDATRRSTALFFLMHYGFFHLVYFVFVVVEARGSLGSIFGYVVCAVIFAVNHAYSLAHNLRRDAAGRPNIGVLMFLPYARIAPMHLVIVFGAHVFGGPVVFIVFGLLKTAADLVMHVVEHHVLRK